MIRGFFIDCQVGSGVWRIPVCSWSRFREEISIADQSSASQSPHRRPCAGGQLTGQRRDRRNSGPLPQLCGLSLSRAARRRKINESAVPYRFYRIAGGDSTEAFFCESPELHSNFSKISTAYWLKFAETVLTKIYESCIIGNGCNIWIVFSYIYYVIGIETLTMRGENP